MPAAGSLDGPAVSATSSVLAEPAPIRIALITLALAFLGLVLVAPILTIVVEALRDGVGAWWSAVFDPETVSAIKLTALTAAICLPLNILFGLAAAWSLGRYDVRGKSVLLTLIDLPLAVSPVISGMIFVLLFGSQGIFGRWLAARGLAVIFGKPGIVLATAFVTFSYVARELTSLVQEQGMAEELAAMVLGASSWQVFFRVSLPKMRWALLHGALLANARAIGEFGAVSVVSGHIRGLTTTAPLQIEILYNEYRFSAAFAVATVLILIAILTLVAKKWVEARLDARR
jgi:sulfate transport system permease protein